MKRLSTLTKKAIQNISFITDSSEKIYLVFRFLPTQNTWFLDISSDKINISGLRVCCSPNILDKWHNILDFGISVTTDDGLDPFRIEDFESGYCFVSIINKEELKRTTDYLNGNT